MGTDWKKHSNGRIAKALVGLFLLVGLALNAVAADWTYTVRPGDDLWRLSAKYCGSSSFAARLATHNGLARPSALRPGQRLRIPVKWLLRYPAEVEVKLVAGTVTKQDGQPLAPRDRIMMGDRVLTGADSFAVVIFADGSTMEIGENGEVLFNILTSYGETGMVDTHLRFYRGRGAVRVEKRPAPSQFRIWTPSGIAAVRGTNFRVGTLPDEAGDADASVDAPSRVETVTGSVDFNQAQKVIDLPAGYGVVASTAGTNKEELLRAPNISDANRKLWQPGQRVRWSADSQAREYRIKLYRRLVGGNQPLRSIAQQQTEYDLTGLPAGDYAFAVRAVAISGLEGFDSQLAFTMGALAPKADATSELLRGDTLRWIDAGGSADQPYEVQVAANNSFTDAASYTSAAAQLALADTVAAQPGVYHWRVRRADSAYSKAQQITVRPGAVGRVAVRKQGWQKPVNGQTLAVSWLARSEEQYTLNIYDAAGADPVHSASAIETGRYETPPLPVGRYRVEVAATAGGISGAVQSTEVKVVKPTPWWWATLLFVPLLFAL